MLPCFPTVIVSLYFPSYIEVRPFAEYHSLQLWVVNLSSGVKKSWKNDVSFSDNEVKDV